MKKLLQIVGITIGSIIGLVVVAAAVAVWCVFTPERLTPVVRNIADQYITCEWDMGDVDLTFFSTFPEFGLHIDGLYLVNPMKGAQSDTVLVAPSVVAKLDVMAYLQHNNLIIREIDLPDMEANIFINALGENNLSVFQTTPDTTSQDSAFSLPFDTLMVQACALEARHLSFVDEKDTISASLNATQLALRIATWEDVYLHLSSEDVSVQMKGETYANHLRLQLDLPTSMDLEKMYFRLKEAQLSINEWTMTIDGETSIGDSIALDAQLALADWNIRSVLDLLPPSVSNSLQDIDVDGGLSLNATIQGIYSESQMPLIDAHVQIHDGQGQYAALPYAFSQVEIDANAHLDLNNQALSCVKINQLNAQTMQTKVNIRGQVKDIMGKQLTKAHIALKANIPDWKDYLPETLAVNGRIQSEIDVEARIADVLAQRLNRVKVGGKIGLEDIDVQTDSLQAQLESAQVDVQLHLAEWPLVKANIGLQSTALLTVKADSIDAQMLAPNIKAYAAVDIKDSTQIPTFDATIQFMELQGQYANYKAHLGPSELEGKMTNSRRNQSVPVFKGTLSTSNLKLDDHQNHITVNDLNIEARSLYKKDGDKFLLKWNPMLNFALNQAEADLAGFEQHISIPQIAFKYNNRDFDILNSRIQLGKSDFSLTGDIHNIGKWLTDQAVLTGELNFTSDHTDVNELLNLFSADAGSEETTTKTTTTTTTKTDTTGSGPFLVPNNVDLTLNTHIGEAVVFDQVAKNLGGKVYIKDGLLVLEEMGFVCDAAKLQLTAMYRTPRRDHIYVGLDYHMLDVKIDQLISMVPQIDTMMPMLKSFKGEAEFHLGVETYLRSDYSIKTSTLRGACSLFGKDLVVMDSETFDKISKILLFKKKTENIVDSLSAEITLYKDEVDIYPFCISMDNYMVALGGRHKLDMSYNYHVNLLSPFYIGVDVNGTSGNLNIKPAKCVYAKDFRPIVHNSVDTQNAQLRSLIRDSLRKNVKIQ